MHDEHAWHAVGDGPPLLVLHAFGTDGHVAHHAFEPALPDGLARRRIYLDLPGCGDAQPTAEATSEAVLASVLAFADERLGAGPIDLAGHSYGGYLAAAIARRHPERIGALLLVCPGVRIRPADRDVPHDGLPTPPEAQRLLDGLHGRHEAYLTALRDHGYRLADEDGEGARPFGGPTTILAGRRDGIAGYADQFRALARYRDATYAAVAGAGHWLPFEQPAAFRALVGDWARRALQSVAGTGR